MTNPNENVWCCNTINTNDTSKKKSTNTIELETEFDSSEYICVEKRAGKRINSGDFEKFNQQQPRQPKKRSLTSQLDEVKFLESRFSFIFFLI
jgi:hypothetical protein